MNGETDLGHPVVDGMDEDAHLRADVENERAEMRDFVRSLSTEDIKSGGWFTKLLQSALNAYTTKVDWSYFQAKYPGVPADVIVDQRIKMAVRYAGIEGLLSAGAYTGTVAATIGTGGGASPLTIPAAVTTVMIDVAYITRLQLRLAYDIAVLYRLPLDLEDPEDLWKLIRVAFTIKGSETAREGAIKAVPLAMRPLIKRFYSRGVLNAAKGFPVVGKYLLQRNAIKIGIPLVGVPLAVVLNRYTTQVAGRHARSVFRNEARLIEEADRLSTASRHPELALKVTWLVIMADGRISNDESLFLRFLVGAVERDHQVVDRELAETIEIDLKRFWREIAAAVDVADDDLDDIVDLSRRVAAIDGEPNKKERVLLEAIADHCQSAQG
ncbi:MAG: hypothetical protein ACK4UY_13710 [Dietzia sp.]